MRAVTVTKTGAFMDAGLERDLLVPVSQQLSPMVEGRSYVVYPFLDPKKQLIGSTKLHRFLDERAKNMAAGERVDLMIVNETELGFKAVINGTHLGLLYKGEVFRPLKPGDEIQGYIKSIRPDRKIDLCLQRQDKESRAELTDQILAFLRTHGADVATVGHHPDQGDIRDVVELHDALALDVLVTGLAEHVDEARLAYLARDEP